MTVIGPEPQESERFADEEARQTHIAQIAGRITDILPYGPLEVITHVQDIPGITYTEDFWRFDKPKRPSFAKIGGQSLKVFGEGEGMQVLVIPDGNTETAALQLDQIDSAHVEHPYGWEMPLHGNIVPTPVIMTRDGVTHVEWAPRFIEYGYYDRLERTIHPAFPGIGVINLYKASRFDENWEEIPVPSFEEAKASDTTHRSVLVSKTPKGVGIVTSRLGYDETRQSFVRPAERMQPMHVEMVDMSKDTLDEEVLKHHIDQLEGWPLRGSARKPITQMEVDEIYLYATSD